MPRPPAASPYAPIAGGPWLAKVVSDDVGVAVTLTDLLHVYKGQCSDSILQQQMEEFEPDQAIPLLHRCLEGNGPEGQFSFRVVDERGEEGGIVRLQWDLRGSVAYNIPCYGVASSAALLRDDLMAPLLRACTSARSILPADAVWPPPCTAASPGPTLPDFAAPGLAILLERLQPSAPQAMTRCGDESGGGGAQAGGCGGAACGSIASSGTEANRPSGQGQAASIGGSGIPPSQAHAAQAADSAVHGGGGDGQGPSVGATSTATTAEDEQRKRARGKREKAAAKDKMRKLS
jgi:hypothetical protein